MATLGILGSHLAGDFFLGVDILVTSMLVNFLLMALSVLDAAARATRRSRGRSPSSRRAPCRRRSPWLGVVVLAGFLGRAHVEGSDRSRRGVVFPLDAGLGRGDGASARSSIWREVRRCAAPASTSRRASRRCRRSRRAPMSQLTCLERIDLSPPISAISRVLTGLWQIADMERDGRTLDLDRAARGDAALRRRRASPRSTWPITTDRRRTSPASSARRAPQEQRAAVHEVGARSPGRSRRPTVRAASTRALTRLRVERSTCCSSTPGTMPIRAGSTRCFDLQELKAEGLIASPRPDQRRHRASARRARQRHRDRRRTRCRSRCSIGAPRADAGAVLRRARRAAARLRHASPAAGSPSDGSARPSPTGSGSGTWSQMKYGRFMRAAGGWERAAAGAARGRGGGRAPRRLDRQRRQPLHPRTARPSPPSSSAPGSASGSTSTTRCGCSRFALTDEDRARARGGARRRCTRFPATAATSTASRRF